MGRWSLGGSRTRVYRLAGASGGWAGVSEGKPRAPPLEGGPVPRPPLSHASPFFQPQICGPPLRHQPIINTSRKPH